MTEHDIQNAIRIELSKRGYITERINVGTGVLVSERDARQIRGILIAAGHPELAEKMRHFDTGAIKGRSDLDVIKDGMISFLEVKTETGSATPDQLRFIRIMREHGCRAGVVRSVDDALKILRGR